jgi:hypothetical protein
VESKGAKDCGLFERDISLRSHSCDGGAPPEPCILILECQGCGRHAQETSKARIEHRIDGLSLQVNGNRWPPRVAGQAKDIAPVGRAQCAGLDLNFLAFIVEREEAIAECWEAENAIDPCADRLTDLAEVKNDCLQAFEMSFTDLEVRDA